MFTATDDKSFDLKRQLFFDTSGCSPILKNVLEEIRRYYAEYESTSTPANFIQQKTKHVGLIRNQVQVFINARYSDEIVFSRGASEAINFVANGLDLHLGEEILVSDVEHLANIIPWIYNAQKKGGIVRRIPCSTTGNIDVSALEEMINDKTKIVCLSHASNIYGNIQDVVDIVQVIKKYGKLVLVDAAQSIGRTSIDVQKMNCDFLVASGRKALMMPLGLGFLYGKRDALNNLNSTLTTTRNILTSDDHGYFLVTSPERLEGNLPNLAYILALGKSIEYLSNIGINVISKNIQTLSSYLIEELGRLPFTRIFSETIIDKQVGVISFVMDSQAPRFIARSLLEDNIVIGHGQLGVDFLKSRLGYDEINRISLHYYNTQMGVDLLVEKLSQIYSSRKI